jgi:hypothetical protein
MLNGLGSYTGEPLYSISLCRKAHRYQGAGYRQYSPYSLSGANHLPNQGGTAGILLVLGLFNQWM